jgi:hypothetical protein
LAIVGVTDRSIRSIVSPASSIRRNRWSGELAASAASMFSAAVVKNTTGSGCTAARLSIHGSRARTHTIASGSTPFSSSQMHASVAVLPEPAITYCDGASPRLTRSLTGTTCTPSATPKGGGLVAGIIGER